MHGVVRFDPKTGVQQKGKPKTGSYTNYFADALIAEAERDNRVVAIHAAMAGGTGETGRAVLAWAGSCACCLSFRIVHRQGGRTTCQHRVELRAGCLHGSCC
jgi:hypothetical protein